MANIFQDAGRSNLFPVAQGVFRDALAVGEQERQGNMAVLQAQEAQRRTAIMQAEEARRIQEDARKQEAYAKQKAFEEKPFNIKFSPLLSTHKDAEDYPQKFEQLRQIMGADEMGNTTHGNVVRGTNEMLKSPDMIKEWFKPRLDALEEQIHANNDKLYKAKLAGDEEGVKKLTGIQQTLQDQYLMKSGEYGKKILDAAKQKPAETWVDENRTVQGKQIEGQRNTATNKWEARAQGSTININTMSPEQTNTLVDSFADGKLAPRQIPKRGKAWTDLTAGVAEKYPKFDFTKADANYNYMNNANNLRSIGLVKTAMPRVDDLQAKISALQNTTNIPIMDKPLNKIKRDIGNVPVADYESLRNAIIQEINTALSGSAVSTDYRIKLELEQLGSDRTPAQLNAAIHNLKIALEARADASIAVPYDWDEVRTGVKKPVEVTKSAPSGYEVPPSGWRFTGKLDPFGAPIYIGPGGTERPSRKK